VAQKRSAIVPRAVLKASFASVVPACVVLGLQACGNTGPLGVAAVAYCCFDASVGDGDASDAKTVDAPHDGSSDAVSDAVDEVKD
jgi:hypothetical protein